MEKIFLVTGFSLATMAPAFAQGYIDFRWLGGTGITIAAPSNPSTQLPGWFCGSDYTVQAYMAAGAGQAESSLAPVATCKTTFLGNATSASGGPESNGEGFWASTFTSDTGYAVGVVDTIQIRAWYSGGGATTYQAALSAGVNTGKSSLYSITPKGNTDPTVQSMDDIGLQAFTVASIIPEPSTLALSGAGAAALLILRRRK